MEAGKMALVELKGLTKFFGGLVAVLDLHMEVGSRQIYGLIGPNGAGKSTVLNLIGGDLTVDRGQILFYGEDVTRLSPHRRAERGIARVFQENLLFSGFTLLENVRIGLRLRSKSAITDLFLRTPSKRIQQENLIAEAKEILHFVGLPNDGNKLAADLPHGKQRLLALAVALATRPKLLLLDEPVSGMNAREVDEMIVTITRLREEKEMTCIIIEHNLRAVMGLCDEIAVLNFGRKIASGPPAAITENPAVTEAYLGSDISF
jgi:branched-chain amino acid transport system ATP-binding protein